MKHNIIILILIISIISLNSFGENIPKKLTPCNLATNSANAGFVRNAKGASNIENIIDVGEKIPTTNLRTFLNANNVPETEHEKFLDLIDIGRLNPKGVSLSDINRITNNKFSPESINKIDLMPVAVSLDVSRGLKDIVDTSLYLGSLNIKRINFWYENGVKLHDRSLLRYAIEDTKDLSKTFKTLRDRIDGARNVEGMADPKLWDIYTTQINKLDNRIRELQEISSKIDKAYTTMPPKPISTKK